LQEFHFPHDTVSASIQALPARSLTIPELVKDDRCERDRDEWQSADRTGRQVAYDIGVQESPDP